MASAPLHKAAALAALALPLLGASPPGHVDVSVSGLRDSRGIVRACMTLRADIFPDCEADPAARRLSVPAANAAALAFGDLPSGDYAVALFHDANGNGKLDTAFGIPKEGFGFSRNPTILFGPPRFAAARFAVRGGTTAQPVRLRYML